MRFAPTRRAGPATVIAALGLALPAGAAATTAAQPEIPSSPADPILLALACPPWYGVADPDTGCAPYWAVPFGALADPFWTIAPFAA
jgi:hypothetical protein